MTTVALIIEHGEVHSVWTSKEMAQAYIDDDPGSFYRPKVEERHVFSGFMHEGGSWAR